jgi:hypothetical protein
MKKRVFPAAADFLREIGRTDQQYFSCASAYSSNQLKKEYAPKSEPDVGERRDEMRLDVFRHYGHGI